MKELKIIFINLIILFFINNIKSANLDSLFINGNRAYQDKEYEKAALLYNQIYETGKSSAILCYNLGNCYFKLSDYAKAILWYERAKKISPNDDDIKFNLQIAQLKIIDKIEVIPELFFISWWKNFSKLFSYNQWAVISIITFAIFLTILALFLITKSLIIRKTTFWISFACLILFAITTLFAVQQYNEIFFNKEAIVIDATVNAKSSPDENSKTIFVIHYGLKVNVNDNIDKWTEIRLPNGTKGWIRDEQIEII